MIETLSKDVFDMKASIRFKKKSQVTIPKEMVEALGLKEGDLMDIVMEDGKLVLVPTITVPKDQRWFWSEKWQKEEREADEDLKMGRLKGFTDVEDLLHDLDSDEED